MMTAWLFVVAAKQTLQSFDMDLYHNGVWVGDSKTRIERTTLHGKPAIRESRTTQVSRSSGRIKPMFSDLVQFREPDGGLIELTYLFSTGIEAQEMRVTWAAETIRVERRGFGPRGAYEPSVEVIERSKAQNLGGTPLDSLLFGGAGKKSSVALSFNFDSKKADESVIAYIGPATLRTGDVSTRSHEYHVRRGKAVLYKVFLDDRTDQPLRIESIDGLLMLPKKRP